MKPQINNHNVIKPIRIRYAISVRAGLEYQNGLEKKSTEFKRDIDVDFKQNMKLNHIFHIENERCRRKLEHAFITTNHTR